MRIRAFKGLWLHYRDSARPVERIEQTTYAFNNDARECLVLNRAHLIWLLATGRYEVIGVEVADPVAPPVLPSGSAAGGLPGEGGPLKDHPHVFTTSIRQPKKGRGKA